GAKEELRQATALYERAAALLNREPARARRALDTCLYLARAHLATGDAGAAKSRVRTCRLRAPRVRANRWRHPPEVRALLEEVDRRMTRAPHGTLEVTNDDRGCSVRLNGVALGKAPLRIHCLPF